MPAAASTRFTALDVFRGMTVCFMIIVNTPGNYDTTFAPLLHAEWHGFTPTDLVFPSFLFAVGNALSLVIPKWSGMQQSAVIQKILKRTAIIFLLGFLMYWFPFVKYENGVYAFAPFSHTRVFGVLQRIALCYGAAALLFYFLKPGKVYMIAGGLLFLYWGLAYWLAADPAAALTLEGNATLRIDRWLLGDKHLYHGEGIAFDPEGLLSTLPSLVNVIAGYAAGDLIRKKGLSYETLAKLLLAGCALMAAAWCWNHFFPINKKLWTSSFSLLTIGLDCVLLAAVIYLIDFAQKTRWTVFFEVFGKNPLFIYLLSEILAIIMWSVRMPDGSDLYSTIYKTLYLPMGAYTGSLAFALSVMLTCWFTGYWLDKKKIYIRV